MTARGLAPMRPDRTQDGSMSTEPKGTNLAAGGPKRRRLAKCARCGYSLKELPTNQCPECGFDNPPGLVGQVRPWIGRVHIAIDFTLIACVAISVVLLGIYGYHQLFGTGYSPRIARRIWVLLALSIVALGLWRRGDEGNTPDLSVARVVYGIIGTIITAGALVWALTMIL